MSQRQIILDTETTGLEPSKGHRVIEIGCVEMVNRRLTNRHFHRYLNPEREIDEGAINVHGLTLDFLKDKPLFADVMLELLDFIKGAELIIHNAPFDIGFLNHEYSRSHQKNFSIKDHCEVIDTLAMARRKHPGQRNSLDALCQRYQVDNSNRELHGALLDAEILAQVYLAMTGGQAHLFQSREEEAEKQSTQSPTRLDANRAPLPIIPVSETEAKAHAALLEKIKSTAGHVLWEE